MTTGQELYNFVTSLNGGASIDETLLTVLVDNAKAILEGERPWMVLRKTDTSKSVTTGNTWQTPIDISTITDFSQFYGELPIRIFDGNNTIEYYRQVPFDRRLEYKDVGNTFCYDAANKTVYLNGIVAFSGTLYINYIGTTSEIDLTAQTAVWSVFPHRFLPVLGYYAIGIHKGAVDYDDINRAMLGPNGDALQALKNAMEKWDNELQLASLEGNDPTNLYPYPRVNAIDRYADS